APSEPNFEDLERALAPQSAPVAPPPLSPEAQALRDEEMIKAAKQLQANVEADYDRLVEGAGKARKSAREDTEKLVEIVTRMAEANARKIERIHGAIAALVDTREKFLGDDT